MPTTPLKDATTPSLARRVWDRVRRSPVLASALVLALCGAYAFVFHRAATLEAISFAHRTLLAWLGIGGSAWAVLGRYLEPDVSPFAKLYIAAFGIVLALLYLRLRR